MGGSARCKGTGIRNLRARSHSVPGIIKRNPECLDRRLTTKSVDQLLHGPKTEEPIDAWKPA
jgi:hypothetical protein